jgi:hypothetical protein
VQNDVPAVLEEPADVLTQRLCFSTGDNAPSTSDDRRRELCKPSMSSAPPCEWWNWEMNFPSWMRAERPSDLLENLQARLPRREGWLLNRC